MGTDAGRTIGNTFDRRHNSLNAIRLILAILVIVSHSWPTGGYGEDPHIGTMTLGNWAVAGFFGISGYLITASRLNSRSLLDYLWRRVLRIYPAFLVVLIVVAFIIAPITAHITGDGPWQAEDAASYLLHNALLQIRQYGIGDTLSTVPYPHVWNGSLWTLFYEFVCYLGIGIIASILPTRWLAAIAIAGLALCAALTVGFEFLNLSAPTTVKYVAQLSGYFLGGTIIYLFRDRIRHSPWLAVAAVGVLVVLVATGITKPFAGLPVAYLMIYAGSALPLQRIGHTNDISYGMYIYAFPVQQVLVNVFPSQELQPLLFAGLATILTVPFAWASWLAIERPAMRLKRIPLRRRTTVDA